MHTKHALISPRCDWKMALVVWGTAFLRIPFTSGQECVDGVKCTGVLPGDWMPNDPMGQQVVVMMMHDGMGWDRNKTWQPRQALPPPRPFRSEHFSIPGRGSQTQTATPEMSEIDQAGLGWAGFKFSFHFRHLDDDNLEIIIRITVQARLLWVELHKGRVRTAGKRGHCISLHCLQRLFACA
ncbi:hypothetical protein B0T19DRAFT_420125 [Cercophora scortea]|uniref:Uncharacterized protein n=1 Tax=Cercophora scortea TaxID=314031 RepID=A0AAE0IZK5_9PEZI|nr:hypothetical protein B0T19DRAFT_420125 [Cercophora scortea]